MRGSASRGSVGPLGCRRWRSKHLRIAEYQQTYEDLEDQIDALYQAAEDAGTFVNTGK